jgi:hypothetical protein
VSCASAATPCYLTDGRGDRPALGLRRWFGWPGGRCSWYLSGVRQADGQDRAVSMRGLISLALAATLTLVAPSISADQTTIEDFEMQPEARWRFFTDTVMGGVSTGQVVILKEDGQSHARMTGRVSTANRGGFISDEGGVESLLMTLAPSISADQTTIEDFEMQPEARWRFFTLSWVACRRSGGHPERGRPVACANDRSRQYRQPGRLHPDEN